MIKVVICGTYRRDPVGLRRLFTELEACGIRILAPLSISFMSTKSAFVRASTDENLDIATLEALHLRAMREADFIWLYAPGGYVGLSGSFELGYATAKALPVVAFEAPLDETIRTQVKIVTSVFDALSQLGFA